MAKKLLSLTLALFALAAGLSNISSLVSLAENKSVTFAVDNENAGQGRWGSLLSIPVLGNTPAPPVGL